MTRLGLRATTGSGPQSRCMPIASNNNGRGGGLGGDLPQLGREGSCVGRYPGAVVSQLRHWLFPAYPSLHGRCCQHPASSVKMSTLRMSSSERSPLPQSTLSSSLASFVVSFLFACFRARRHACLRLSACSRYEVLLFLKTAAAKVRHFIAPTRAIWNAIQDRAIQLNTGLPHHCVFSRCKKKEDTPKEECLVVEFISFHIHVKASSYAGIRCRIPRYWSCRNET